MIGSIYCNHHVRCLDVSAHAIVGRFHAEREARLAKTKPAITKAGTYGADGEAIASALVTYLAIRYAVVDTCG